MADTLTPEAYALLEAISGAESRGAWDVIYGGKKFSDFSSHPRQFVEIKSGPNKGRKSSAAGKFQITATTYDRVAPKLGIKDFSPESQQRIAWHLAKEQYGPKLQTDLASGDPATISRVARKLSPVWTSLPGGIEQGTSGNRFVARFNQAKAHPVPPGNIPGVASLTDTVRTPEPAAMSAQMAQRRQQQMQPLSFNATPDQLATAMETLRAGLAPKPTTTRESIFNPEPSQFSSDPLRTSARGGVAERAATAPPVLPPTRPTVSALPTARGTAGLGTRMAGAVPLLPPRSQFSDDPIRALARGGVAEAATKSRPIPALPPRIGATGGAQAAAGLGGSGGGQSVMRPRITASPGGTMGAGVGATLGGRASFAPPTLPGPSGYTVANKDESRLPASSPLAIAGEQPQSPAAAAIAAAVPSLRIRDNWQLAMMDPTRWAPPQMNQPIVGDPGMEGQFGIPMSEGMSQTLAEGYGVPALPKPTPIGTPNVLGGMQLTRSKPVIMSDLTPRMRAAQNQSVLDLIKRRGAVSTYTGDGGGLIPLRAMDGQVRNSYGDSASGIGSSLSSRERGSHAGKKK